MTDDQTAETDEELEALTDTVFMWTGQQEAPADFPGSLTEALAPQLAAIRRQAAVDALRGQAIRIAKARDTYMARGRTEVDGTEPAVMYRSYAVQARNDARMLNAAADDLIAEGYEHQCAAYTWATRSDPGYGCDTPVESEGDYCDRHEPADDDDPNQDD